MNDRWALVTVRDIPQYLLGRIIAERDNGLRIQIWLGGEKRWSDTVDAYRDETGHVCTDADIPLPTPKQMELSLRGHLKNFFAAFAKKLRRLRFISRHSRRVRFDDDFLN